jgi:hypothetical protein
MLESREGGMLLSDQLSHVPLNDKLHTTGSAKSFIAVP